MIAQQAVSRARTTMTQARAAIEDLGTEAPDVQPFAQTVQGEVQRFSDATGIVCTCSLSETLSLPAAFHEPLLRLVSEGFMNIVRHAQAARVWICGMCNQDTITFEVGDDGIGFDPSVIMNCLGCKKAPVSCNDSLIL